MHGDRAMWSLARMTSNGKVFHGRGRQDNVRGDRLQNRKMELGLVQE